MEQLWAFFLVLFVGVFASTLLRRFHVPWVVALLVAGSLVGGHGLGLVPRSEVITVIAEIGLVFLMFMAGLETRLSSFAAYTRDIATHALFHAAVPFSVGVGLAYLLSFTFIEAIILGIVLMSSSVAVIVPALESEGIIASKLGRIIVASAILVDALSLIALAALLDVRAGGMLLPAYLFYPLLVGVLVTLRWTLPRVETLLAGNSGLVDDQPVRATIAISLGTAVLFSILGLNPILGGFFAGLVLSDTIRDPIIVGKLHAVAYGVFIPAFFVHVGMETDLFALTDLNAGLWFALLLTIVAIASKLVSGLLSARASGYSRADGILMGVSSIPRLSTTLVAVFSANEVGLLGPSLAAALVTMSILTTFLGPVFVRLANAERNGAAVGK